MKRGCSSLSISWCVDQICREATANNVGHIHQEVNPGLADAESVRKTVSVGCSLVRAALGSYSLGRTRSEILNIPLQAKPCCE